MRIGEGSVPMLPYGLVCGGRMGEGSLRDEWACLELVCPLNYFLLTRGVNRLLAGRTPLCLPGRRSSDDGDCGEECPQG